MAKFRERRMSLLAEAITVPLVVLYDLFDRARAALRAAGHPDYQERDDG